MRRRRGTELLGGVSLGDRLQVITRLRRVRQSIACLIIGFCTCIGSSRTNCSIFPQSYSCAGLSRCRLKSYNSARTPVGKEKTHPPSASADKARYHQHASVVQTPTSTRPHPDALPTPPFIGHFLASTIFALRKTDNDVDPHLLFPSITF